MRGSVSSTERVARGCGYHSAFLRSPLVLAVLMIAASGCGGGLAPRRAPDLLVFPGGVDAARQRMAKAERAYDKGHYEEVILLLSDFDREFPGSPLFDSAFLLLGRAHQANEEYLLARQAFRRILEETPGSPLAEDALFEIGRCWFLAIGGPERDPGPAEEAISTFGQYLERYPGGKYVSEAQEGLERARETLAKKDYLNGRTYLRLGYYGAARRYFRKSLERKADSRCSGLALAGLAEAYEREGRRAEAVRVYRRLIGHLQESPQDFEKGGALLRKAQRRLRRLEQES